MPEKLEEVVALLSCNRDMPIVPIAGAPLNGMTIHENGLVVTCPDEQNYRYRPDTLVAVIEPSYNWADD